MRSFWNLTRGRSKHASLAERTQRRRLRAARVSPACEPLESRRLLATYTVTNLLDAGVGSLRQAIDEANANAGGDQIAFAVAGTVQLASPLSPITDALTIDGSTAPGYTSLPLVTVDFNASPGLVLAAGSNGSVVRGLSLGGANGAGLTLFSSTNTLEANFIGVAADGLTAHSNATAGVIIAAGSSMNTIGSSAGGNLIGGNGTQGLLIYGDDNTVDSNLIGTALTGTTPLPNGSDGIRLVPGASGNLIGNDDPVLGIDYFGTTDVSLPVQTWTGIRGLADGQFLITGTSQSDGVESGLLYVGPLEGAAAAKAYAINYPGAPGTATSVYGPDDLGDGEIVLVGTYVLPGDTTRYGFSFRGNLATMDADIANPANYTTIWNGSPFNYVHSTMGGLAVGNYVTSDSPTETGRSFIYDLTSEEFVTDIVFPGSLSNTAYGIWDNGDGSYTIAGGFSELPVNNSTDPFEPLGLASLVDYNRLTGAFSNWRSFSYEGSDVGTPVTHFQGISSVEKGVYTLSADAVVVGASPAAGWATVTRNTNGSFGDMTWVEISAAEPVAGEPGITSANSVYGNAVIGVVATASGVSGYQSRVNLGKHPANVISGNAGNGIAVIGSSRNVIAMNHIGTDVSGTSAVPNALNGILLTRNAAGNTIGGTATANNDPTADVFARPPQGNLISGNTSNGVAIAAGATANTLMGNFIGTTASGNESLANARDGVAIASANGNALLGTTFRQSPFVFYNVLSGNAGNGLRITNANNTTVQANFFGISANNASAVPNGGSGILVNGSSANAIVGGVIPLGNVCSGNSGHGIHVADEASGFVSFNTFTGVAAFGGAVPNGLNGIQITATGGNNLIRTCIVSGNLGNGIVIGGDASGVTVEDTAAGTNTGIAYQVHNGGSGIVITGTAHRNAIGGYQPSVETNVHTSGNLRYGIEIRGNAYDNKIFNTVVGGGFFPETAIPNALGGIYVGQGTSGTVIGGSGPFTANRVVYNSGPGITLGKATRTVVLGNEIHQNVGDGLWINAGVENLIGLPGSGNTIISNQGNGIRIAGDTQGTRVMANQIMDSGLSGVSLTAAENLMVGESPLDSLLERLGIIWYGATDAANVIVTSAAYGLLASGDCSGTSVIRNTLRENSLGNVDITAATGITYVP
jgi:hypothetical protein